MSTIVLPVINIQHDFTNVIADIQDGTIQQEDFWVSCYKKGESSVHGKVNVSLGEQGAGAQLTSRLGVNFARGSSVSRLSRPGFAHLCGLNVALN